MKTHMMKTILREFLQFFCRLKLDKLRVNVSNADELTWEENKSIIMTLLVFESLIL